MATGTVVSTMQAGAEATSQKRGRAGQASMVSQEARAVVMKAAMAALHHLVEVAVEVGLVVQVALMSTFFCLPVVVAPGTLAAA